MFKNVRQIDWFKQSPQSRFKTNGCHVLYEIQIIILITKNNTRMIPFLLYVFENLSYLKQITIVYLSYFLLLPSLTPTGFIHPGYTAGGKSSSFAPALFTSPDQILWDKHHLGVMCEDFIRTCPAHPGYGHQRCEVWCAVTGAQVILPKASFLNDQAGHMVAPPTAPPQANQVKPNYCDL